MQEREGIKEKRERTREYEETIVFLPPIERRGGGNFSYPKTILDGFIYTGQLSCEEAVLVFERIRIQSADHFDVTAVRNGENARITSGIVTRAIRDVLHEKVKIKPIHYRHSSDLLREMCGALEDGQCLVVGGKHKARLLTGFGENKKEARQLDVIDPEEGNTYVIVDLHGIARRVAKRGGLAIPIKKTPTPIS